MAETPLATEEQNNEPQQIDAPPYPGTSKIENGQAFDIAGKVLGSVDDSGKAVAKQAAPAQEPAGGAFDFGFKSQPAETHATAQPVQQAPATRPSGFDFGFKPASVGAATGTKWDSYARMGNYFYAKPFEGEENKGVAHSLHTFLSFPNALYHAFQDPATEQEKLEIGQKMNEMRAGQGMPAASTLPTVPGEYAGMATNTYDKKTPPPTRTQLALHRLVDAPADQLDAKANKELETARELWDSRESWGASIPVGMGISIPLGPAIALSQSVSGAADKVLSKIPMLGPLVNSIAEKFENGDVSGGLTDIALLKAAEHVHGKITGEEPAVPSRIFTDKGHELGKGARAAFDKMKEATVDKLKPTVSDAASAAKEDFKSAAPPSKAAPYDDNDYEIVRRTAEQGHKADKLQGGEGISGIETARDIVEDGRQTIEAKRSGAVQKFADKPITTNVFEDVANELAEKDKTTPGFRDEGMKVLDEHNFKDLTNGEADAIRKTMVAKNRLMEKNPWDAASLRESNPEYAARETVIDSLRKGIYGSLQEAGVPEAYDWARDEAAHIRVRKALDRQIFNSEKTVRGSADVGPVRKVAAQVARAGAATAGTGIGAAVGGVPGAIIGGAAGTVAGEGISRAILPPDMTRNELMARSFSGERELATPGGPSVPPSQATEVPYPQGPAGPDLPPPPAPIPPVMPPPDHALHAALATRIGTTVERSNLDNLLSKFQEYLDNTPTNKLTDGDRDLLQQLNESQAERKNKVTEAVQKAYDQNKAAREKWQAEVKKIQEKHAAEEESAIQTAIDEKETGETSTDENPHLASLNRGDESGLVSHSFASKAHSPILPIADLPEGMTPEMAMRHEFTHLALDAIDGEPTGHEIRSDSHPKATPGIGASAVFDASAITDPEGNINPEALQGQLTKWLTQKMGGPASHEVFDGLTKEDALDNPATRQDVRRARAFVREVHPEFSPSQVEEVVDAAYERARDFISQPHIAERIKANAAVREDGLPATHHASRGRVTQFQKDILEAHNEFEGTTNPEPSGGGTGEGGKKAEKPAAEEGKKNAGGAKDGGKAESRKPVGKSKAASGVVESSAVSKAAEEETAYHPDLQKLADTYGASTDASKVRNGASFIAPDGKFIHLGSTEHPVAIESLTGREGDAEAVGAKMTRSSGAEDSRIGFMRDTGAIRTRFRQSVAGKELVASVPAKGVTEEQVSALRQAVGQGLGRNGNLLMEVGEPGGTSATKEFASPRDVEPMLREIGAHPESGDWMQKAADTKGEGFSYHPKTGAAPTDGYMVETELNRGQSYDHPPTADDIRAYVEKNKDFLDKNPDLYVGGYKNTLGLSKRFSDQAAAEELGKKTNQVSIYDVAGKKEIPTGGTGEVTQPVEESAISKKSPKGSSVPLMENPLPVKGTMEGSEVGTLDVTKALNAFSRKSNPALEPGSEPKEMVARAKKIAEDEAKYQLAQSKTGTEWYTTEMKDHDAVLQKERPELTGGEMTDAIPDHPVKLTLFKAAEAILSSGQKPYANVKSALRAWDVYNETGQFPRSNPTAGKEGMSWGPRNVNAYGNAFDAVNKLIAEKGEKGAADWLLNEHPVSELREYGENVSGKKDDMEAGAKILGEKRGPFMQNLHGIESKFTADMWVSRTWNRWMGTLDLNPRIESKGKMTSESDVPRNNTERSLMKESFEKTAGKLGLSTSSLQAVLWYYEQALYRAHGLPVESWSFSDAAKRVAAEAKAAPEAEQTGFNFGENEGKKQGVLEGLAGKPNKAGRVSALDLINTLKKK